MGEIQERWAARKKKARGASSWVRDVGMSIRES